MPIYDYRCSACGKESEMLVSGDAAPACPHCGQNALDKLISAPSAPGRSAKMIASVRRRAAREGHFSHYAKSERPRRR